jgi:hypothetical protein
VRLDLDYCPSLWCLWQTLGDGIDATAKVTRLVAAANLLPFLVCVKLYAYAAKLIEHAGLLAHSRIEKP